MINFVAGSPKNTAKYMNAHGVGHLAGVMSSPNAANDVRHAVELGMPWVLDNDCFTSYSPSNINRMLERYHGITGCRFATVPDVVGNHTMTLERFYQWYDRYDQSGFPLAFVLQDGCSVHAVPWHQISAVFIGGSDRFKHSPTVQDITAEAIRLGKWVHMGRVNTRQRIRYASAIGCDSIDGLRWARFRDCYHFAQELSYRQGMLKWD